jgi:hypothetical protein
MVEFACETMMDPNASRKDRLAAAEFLTDRMLGKAPQLIDLDVQGPPVVVARQAEPPDGADWAALSDDNLKALLTVHVSAPEPATPSLLV